MSILDKIAPTCYTITILKKSRDSKIKEAQTMLEKMLKAFYEFQVLYIH